MKQILQTVFFLLTLGVGMTLAQSGVPIISGGAGLISTTDGGQNFFQPVIAPVVVAPLSSRLLLESRFDLREFIAKDVNGNYDATGFTAVDYLQLDFRVAPRLTVSVGRFLSPFNMYSERVSAVWIHNFQEAPLIFPIGTRTAGSNDGVMLRGAAISTPDWQLNYTAYYSANSSVDKFESGRAAGGRAGLFITKPRLEIGASYQRFLQDQHYNATGAYLSWQPPQVPVEVRSEYAHSPAGLGYWVEGAFRFVNAPVNSSLIARLEPVLRIQQFWRSSFLPQDLLPRGDARQADVGVNYYLPRNVRVNASYGRFLNSIGADRNDWNIAVSYRFLFPVFPGQSK
ncbi:MAG: hypothetical protein ROO76_06930 [Terriglobia bacterium]|jgi:hypothetical protein|nr:hypothetical protein [Terriglobia bacterium]